MFSVVWCPVVPRRGATLARLPVDLPVGKMVILGCGWAWVMSARSQSITETPTLLFIAFLTPDFFTQLIPLLIGYTATKQRYVLVSFLSHRWEYFFASSRPSTPLPEIKPPTSLITSPFLIPKCRPAPGAVVPEVRDAMLSLAATFCVQPARRHLGIHRRSLYVMLRASVFYKPCERLLPNTTWLVEISFQKLKIFDHVSVVDHVSFLFISYTFATFPQRCEYSLFPLFSPTV